MRYLLLPLLFISFYAFGQGDYTVKSKNAIKHYEEGLRNFRLYYYDVAEQELLKAIQAEENFIEAYIVLARIYVKTDKLEQAVEYLSKGLPINPGFYTIGYLEKGEIEMYLGRYADAHQSFTELLQYEKKNTSMIERGKKGIEKADFCANAVKKPVEFKPVRLSNAINSKDDEYWPSLSADEQTLVITRLVGSHEKKFVQEDFYISHRLDTVWQTAENAGQPLNTNDNEGAQSISANGKIMVYTVCNRQGIFGKCDLYYSINRGGEWSKPVNIGPDVNTKAKETQPSITADGRGIYFASDRPGGKGGLDIWYTEYIGNGKWSKPVNLGDSINSKGDETSPFIHSDNSTLYFASDYFLGLGGFDLFISRKNENGDWGWAKNLGYPINTSRDERGLIVNSKGNRAYYSTNIDTAYGQDIYTFEMPIQTRPNEVSYLKGRVYDANTKKMLQASFELFNLPDGKLISKSASDPVSGEFLVSIPTNKDFMLNVSKEGYLFYSDNFSLNGIFHLEEPFYKDVPLQPVDIGRAIVLNNIFFETDEYSLKDESKHELQKVISFLKSNPTIKVEIGGHTDNIGSASYNKELSKKRGQAVVDYLTEFGVERSRLVAKGYGFDKPVQSNDSEAGRAANRRTELTVIDK